MPWTPVVRFGKSYLKLECLQPVGSFKIRGALTKRSELLPAARSSGVVSYSSGNHGWAVAHVARRLGVSATIVVPSDAPATKLLAIAREQAEIVSVAAHSDERRLAAEALARETGKALIPPYDDRAVIIGQGTVGFELLQQLKDMTSVVVPVGGGGLISGVAAALKAARPAVQVVGVEPEYAADARESFLSGHLVHWGPERVARDLDPAGLITASQVFTGSKSVVASDDAQAARRSRSMSRSISVLRFSRARRNAGGDGPGLVRSAMPAYNTRLCSRVRKTAAANPKSVTS